MCSGACMYVCTSSDTCVLQGEAFRVVIMYMYIHINLYIHIYVDIGQGVGFDSPAFWRHVDPPVYLSIYL
jgi:hypothetical protein